MSRYCSCRQLSKTMEKHGKNLSLLPENPSIFYAPWTLGCSCQSRRSFQGRVEAFCVFGFGLGVSLITLESVLRPEWWE